MVCPVAELRGYPPIVRSTMSNAWFAGEEGELFLQRTAGVWEALRGEAVVLTGASGFVGSWLMESWRLAERAYGLGSRMIAVSRDPGRVRERRPWLAEDRSIVWVAADV